jgi:formate dehydrogenase iron-sulfur subunit
MTDAYLYGADRMLGKGLNAFFLLNDRPDVYNLPAHPRRPVRNIRPSYLAGLAMAVGLLVAGALAFAGKEPAR